MPAINILRVSVSTIPSLFNVLTRSMEELELDGAGGVLVLQVSFIVFFSQWMSALKMFFFSRTLCSDFFVFFSFCFLEYLCLFRRWKG